jgi:8-oxo-dGTP pyrophosphatase MutT (NUDIX family)
VPFILRPTYDGAHSGQVSLPGGKFEPDDRDLLDTARRETQEEIGVEGNKIKLIGSLSEMYIVVSNFKVLPVVGYLDHKPAFIPEIKEVARIIHSPLDHILDQQRRKEKDIIVGNNYKIRSPYFDIDGEVIWGATAMILSELVTLIQEIEE